MRWPAIIAAFAGALAGALFGLWLSSAHAWWHGETGVVVVPPTCSNQFLNFADPCNSAYVVMRL